MKKLNNDWFYSSSWWTQAVWFIFVRGDLFGVLPIIVFLLFVLIFFGLKTFAIAYLVTSSVRAAGEMVYWLLQQFGKQDYRPYDYGLKELPNNAIYIIYQTLMFSIMSISLIGIFLLLTI